MTQQNQLKRLCQRYRALGRDSELEKIADLDFSSSNEALGLLSKGIKFNSTNVFSAIYIEKEVQSHGASKGNP
ncbi:MAG: hypothetical protein Ct9H300mP22_3050 [Gammaproteobacteria bacterium]|nr:MAG: hypothetical protein Ct9H300mP22_3050 [Gammaproteobacteria bacterium]